jgi:cytochrome c-type biogenesis protein CcmH/NrfG
MSIIAIYKLTTKSNLTLPLIIIIVSLFFVLVNQQLPSLLKIPIEIRPDLSSTAVVLKNTLTGKQIFWGSGPATFSFDFDRFRPLDLNQSAFWYFKFSQGFSFLGTLIITLGLLGILAFLFILFILARRILKILKDGNEELLIVAAGLSFLLIILFVYPASYVQLLYLFLGIGILAISANRSYQIDFDSGKKWRKAKDLVILSGAALLLVFVLSGIYSLGQKYMAAIYYAKGLAGSSTAQSFEYLNKAVQLDPLADNYWRVLSQVLLVKADELIRTDQTQGSNNIAGAVSSARRATELNPQNSLNWSNLGNLYENIIPIKGADVLAEQNYNQAITLNPNNPQGFVDLARVLMISKKIDEAKSNLEQSINLKADYLPAHYLLGILYQQNEQTDQAQGEFETVLALNENYSNASYFLGLIYDKKGYKQAALEQFEKIEKLNPDNQEIKKILENLKAGRPAL